mmetsp:Transcript_66088/g.153500  ORF Transcript_66088/g.153500 Transcript_66088/m.153500 type:complete len:97 (+) Transcript_66088:260-550(+)
MTKATHVDEPVVVGADAREVRELLRCRVHRRATLCNRGAYPDFAARMAEASRVGAVIQAEEKQEEQGQEEQEEQENRLLLRLLVSETALGWAPPRP